MPVTIGIVCNLYNEVHALPGWLEAATAFADDVQVYHSGPGGRYSDDGTLEILKAWNIPVTFGAIDEGFGAVRTKTIRLTKCDWAILLDADERFYYCNRFLTCIGENTPPDVENEVLQAYDFRGDDAVQSNFENLHLLGANLTVNLNEVYDQGTWLRGILENDGLDVCATCRRHWHDFSMKRPTQNWHTRPDWQYRIVRPASGVSWGGAMHEGISGGSKHGGANTNHGPFFDHFHFSFKRMAPWDRKYKVAVYDSIHEGRPVPTPEEFANKHGRKDK